MCINHWRYLSQTTNTLVSVIKISHHRKSWPEYPHHPHLHHCHPPGLNWSGLVWSGLAYYTQQQTSYRSTPRAFFTSLHKLPSAPPPFRFRIRTNRITKNNSFIYELWEPPLSLTLFHSLFIPFSLCLF